jgi:low affinity Fe/Cu permease
MKKFNNELALLVSSLTGRKGRLAVMVITIVLFILSAGAPNATIGIGK